ncbi:MAG: hypothetical protein IJ429_03805 [Lachnospiraceae bacterium]|nr:hypothetical protein [Lachnospiraceae bacterium]
MAVVLPMVYIMIFVCQIVFLVKAIKKKNWKTWTILFVLEIASLIIALSLMVYYENLPGYGFMPGLSYLGEVLASFAAALLFFVIFLISAIICIVISEKKRSVSPFLTIVVFVLFVVGIGAMGYEIYSNGDKVKTTATVVDFRETRTGVGIEYWPIYEFEVDGQVYEADYPPVEELRIGDKAEVYCFLQGDTYEVTRYLVNTKWIYIPAFCVGIFVLILRRRRMVRGE